MATAKPNNADPKGAAIEAVSSLVVELCDTAKARTSRDQFALLDAIARLTESINKQ